MWFNENKEKVWRKVFESSFPPYLRIFKQISRGERTKRVRLSSKFDLYSLWIEKWLRTKRKCSII